MCRSLRLSHFVADHTTDGCAANGAQHTAAQYAAGYAANNGAGGSAFFLPCHAGTPRQGQQAGAQGQCEYTSLDVCHGETFCVDSGNSEPSVSKKNELG